LAGLVGGVVLATMFALPGGSDLLRYDLARGSVVAGYLVVVVLGALIGALYGGVVGARAAGDRGQALGFGFLFGLAWFVLIARIIIAVLGGGAAGPALSLRTLEDLIPYLAYGLILGAGFFDLPAALSAERQ
jgi:hypothetical protein